MRRGRRVLRRRGRLFGRDHVRGPWGWRYSSLRIVQSGWVRRRRATRAISSGGATSTISDTCRLERGSIAMLNTAAATAVAPPTVPQN